MVVIVRFLEVLRENRASHHADDELVEAGSLFRLQLAAKGMDAEGAGELFGKFDVGVFVELLGITAYKKDGGGHF